MTLWTSYKKRDLIKEEYLNMTDDEAIAQYLEECRKDIDEFEVIYNNLLKNFVESQSLPKFIQ